MIDYFKSNIINTHFETIEESPYLDFIAKVSTKTGELGAYIYAYYQGLEFRIYEITEKTNYKRITIEGSLHKYWNKGAHNFNDFGIKEIKEVLNDLKSKFKIEAKNCVLRQLEIGVNLTPPYKTKDILKGCILHKTNDFKWVYTKDEGNYIQSVSQRHFIKIYDKRTHYENKGFKIPIEIMRVEKKWRKMIELNNRNIYTLEDLINNDLFNFKTDLVQLWQDVLFCDLETIKGTKNENKYNNLNWWESLNYNNFKYHRNKLNKLLKLNPNNTKQTIANLIDQKVNILNNKTTQINPLCIGLKTVVLPIHKEDENRRFCLVTGLNISMQRNDSFLLSHTGIKYYQKTDNKIFKELLQKHLPNKWTDADQDTKVKELAHNIRTIHTSQIRKQIRLYPESQFRMFG